MNEIWVIDDDRSVRFVLASALREAGHAVREFERATAAIDALQQSTPALAFTDIRLPANWSATRRQCARCSARSAGWHRRRCRC